MSDVTERILNAVADREQCDVMDLPPLYEAVDPEALRRVVGAQTETKVEFTYSQYLVTVEKDGNVHIATDTIAD